MADNKLYEQIKNWYINKNWSIERVWNVTDKGILSDEQYKSITGFTYPNKE